jgi:murein peptide amidase A
MEGSQPADRVRPQPRMDVLIIMLCAWFLSSCASGHREPLPGDLPNVRSLTAVEERLQRVLAASPAFSMETIGTVRYGGFEGPIWHVARQPQGTARQTVLMAAGIHGNEPAGVEALLRFVESVSRDGGDELGVAFHWIPIVNPWGWSHDVRFNADGLDVNRDFATFDSQESRAIRGFLTGKSYDLMVDLHEDPSGKGFYVYQYARPDRKVCENVIRKIRTLGYPIEQDVNMVILKTEDGIIDAPMWGLWYMKLTGQLSMTNYFRLNHSERVFTAETPTSLPWEDRLNMHDAALVEVLRDLQAGGR